MVSAGLVGTIALQSAVPPFATDMYTPAFPEVTTDLATTASLVGLTLTAFFVGMGAGQMVGGPVSDHHGRRVPLVLGGLICTIGAIGSAVAPSVAVLVMARVIQGFGGGVAAGVARAVLVDVARGARLARIMSVLVALGGLAPMIAPIAGAGVLAVGTWRDIFWSLAFFGALMTVTALWFVPETLPRERRHTGGLRESASHIREVLSSRTFSGYVLVSVFSGFSMMAYIANGPYVLQVQLGMGAFAYALFFASTALGQVLVSILNARVVGRIAPRRLVAAGLISSSVAIATLAVGVVALGSPLALVCAGFLVIMSAQGFVFSNANALAASDAPSHAGSASAVLGVGQALGMALAAPLASSGGGATAAPMVAVMLGGVSMSWLGYVIAPPGPTLSATGPDSLVVAGGQKP